MPRPGSARCTPGTAARICAIIRLDGLSDRRAALLAGVTGQALREWKVRDPRLLEQLEQARSEFQQARLGQIRAAAGRDGAVDWRAQAYLLEKAHLPMGSEEPAEETVGAGELSPLLVVPPEQLALLQQRRLAALAKMKP